MERHGDEVHIETDEVRSGSTPHIVRYVLVISLFLAIAALSLIWITGAYDAAQSARMDEASTQASSQP